MLISLEFYMCCVLMTSLIYSVITVKTHIHGVLDIMSQLIWTHCSSWPKTIYEELELHVCMTMRVCVCIYTQELSGTHEITFIFLSLDRFLPVAVFFKSLLISVSVLCFYSELSSGNVPPEVGYSSHLSTVLIIVKEFCHLFIIC